MRRGLTWAALAAVLLAAGMAGQLAGCAGERSPASVDELHHHGWQADPAEDPRGEFDS